MTQENIVQAIINAYSLDGYYPTSEGGDDDANSNHNQS